MDTLIWALLATIALAAVVSVYIFVSAARIFSSHDEYETSPAINGHYQTRSYSDRRENSDRRVFKGNSIFPLQDRFGYTISAERRMDERRQRSDRRLQAA